ncbi:MAG: DUF192 domain-containing protein [Candidatus Binatia bacterium]
MQSNRLQTTALPCGRSRPGLFRASLARALPALALLGLVACSRAASDPVVTVHSASGDAVVSVELALTREAQSRGLMYRTELPEGTGMLFVFDKDAERSFWMSNTPLSLDILYIRSDATIVSIASRTTPFSKTTIPSRGPARYVLEVPGGWSQQHGVKPGDRLTLPDLEGAGRPGD